MQSALADMINHFLTEKADRLSVFGQVLYDKYPAVRSFAITAERV